VRRFHCVQIDVFTSQRLEGNPLAVFTDARGLSDSEMQDLARETNLQETTFVFARDAATEREQG
jgi:trans-2,3-dihydro-3-hydroxyanthranilate isomerase